MDATARIKETTPDRTLIEECLRGSAAAFEALVRRHQPSLIHYAQGFLGTREGAQATVARALRAGLVHLPRLRQNSLLSSFLVGVLRGELRRMGVPKAPDDVRPLWAGLAGLPRVQREVVFLFFQGMTLREVAQTRREAPSHTRARFANGLGHVVKKAAAEVSGAAPLPAGCIGRETLFFRLAGALPAAEERAADDHVAACDRCRRRREAGERFFADLRGEIRPLAEVPPLLKELPGPSFLTTVLAALGVAAVVVGAFLLLRGHLAGGVDHVYKLPPSPPAATP